MSYIHLKSDPDFDSEIGSTTRRAENNRLLIKSYKDVWQRALKMLRDPNIKKKFTNENFRRKQSIVFLAHDHILRLNTERKSIKHVLGVLNPLSYYYLAWLGVLSVAVIYSITFRVFFMAFYDISEVLPIVYCDFFADAILFIDLGINFNLAFHDEKNFLVISRRQIATNYLGTWFVIDSISAIPYTLIDYESQFRIYQIFAILFKFRNIEKFYFLIKFGDILKKFQDLDVPEKVLIYHKEIAKFCKLICLIFWTIHISACIFFWVDKTENFGPNTWVSRNNLQDFFKSEKYLTSLYWALTTLATVGYGDITPKTSSETLIAIIWIFTCAFLLSYSLGLIGDIFKRSKAIIDHNYNILNIFRRYSKACLISEVLQYEIRKYLLTNPDRNEGLDIHQAIKVLSLKERKLISKHIFKRALRKHWFFESKSSVFRATVGILLKFSAFHKDKVLWEEREMPSEMYFVLAGRAKMSFNGTPFMFVGENQYFGDVELALKKMHFYTVSALGYSEYLVMDLRTIEVFKNYFPLYWQEIKACALKRLKRLVQNIAEGIAVRNFKNYESIPELRDDMNNIFKRMYRRISVSKFTEKIKELREIQREYLVTFKRVKTMMEKELKRIK